MPSQSKSCDSSFTHPQVKKKKAKIKVLKGQECFIFTSWPLPETSRGKEGGRRSLHPKGRAPFAELAGAFVHGACRAWMQVCVCVCVRPSVCLSHFPTETCQRHLDCVVSLCGLMWAFSQRTGFMMTFRLNNDNSVSSQHGPACLSLPMGGGKLREIKCGV